MQAATEACSFCYCMHLLTIRCRHVATTTHAAAVGLPDPAQAQQLQLVRLPNFINASEIAQIRRVAEEIRSTGAAEVRQSFVEANAPHISVTQISLRPKSRDRYSPSADFGILGRRRKVL